MLEASASERESVEEPPRHFAIGLALRKSLIRRVLEVANGASDADDKTIDVGPPSVTLVSIAVVEGDPLH